MKRRLSLAGAEQLRRAHISAIAIVLDAQSIQRQGEEEFIVSSIDVAKMSGVPEYIVRRIGRDHFQSIEVRGRVVGYNLGSFHVADNEATDRARHPERYVNRPARADTIGNLPGYHDGETWIPGGL